MNLCMDDSIHEKYEYDQITLLKLEHVYILYLVSHVTSDGIQPAI